MDERPILLVTQYDGGGFAGWQRQPTSRTVQGDMERVLSRLCNQPIAAVGAGRTDAGVHAHGQGVGVRVPSGWEPAALRRAMNALLPAGPTRACTRMDKGSACGYRHPGSRRRCAGP